MQYIEPIITALLLLAYIYIATKQGKYITILKETNEQIKSITSIQSGLISDFKTHRELFNMDDITKQVQLKLDNQRLTIDREYAEKEKAVVQEYLDTSSEHVKTISELSEKIKYYESSRAEMNNELVRIHQEYKKEAIKNQNIFNSLQSDSDSIQKLADAVRKQKEWKDHIDKSVRE